MTRLDLTATNEIAGRIEECQHNLTGLTLTVMELSVPTSALRLIEGMTNLVSLYQEYTDSLVGLLEIATKNLSEVAGRE